MVSHQSHNLFGQSPDRFPEHFCAQAGEGKIALSAYAAHEVFSAKTTCLAKMGSPDEKAHCPHDPGSEVLCSGTGHFDVGPPFKAADPPTQLLL